MKYPINYISKVVLKNIESLKMNNNYVVSESDKTFCPQVNALTLIGLVSLYKISKEEAANAILSSKLYEYNICLFHKRVKPSGEILQEEINVCNNSIAALCLVYCGKEREAKKVMRALLDSAVFGPSKNLFFREMNISTGKLNKRIFVQTNLWVALVLYKLKDSRWKRIFFSLEIETLSKEGFFVSSNCNNSRQIKEVFADDQAIAAILYTLVGKKEKANELLQRLLASSLYSKKTGLFYSSFNKKEVSKSISSYKNGLCGIALGFNGFEKERKLLAKSLVSQLFDSKRGLFNSGIANTSKHPDSNLLSLMAINRNCANNLFD